MYVVMWCINSGYCCSDSKTLCKTWDDYINDLNLCRTNGPVDYFTTSFLSILSCFGLSSFYIGNYFTGVCELVNGIMALMSIFASCFCYNSWRNQHDNNATSTALLVGIVIAILDIAKVLYMANTGSVEIIEIIVMIISIIIVCTHCTENDTNRCHGIITTLFITMMTAVLETIRNIYAVQHYGRDGNGCPLV